MEVKDAIHLAARSSYVNIVETDQPHIKSIMGSNGVVRVNFSDGHIMAHKMKSAIKDSKLRYHEGRYSVLVYRNEDDWSDVGFVQDSSITYVGEPDTLYRLLESYTNSLKN